jgi:putative hydrolases of HD superfamily
MQPLVHLFNEIGMLSHTPRTGFAFLGSGRQSVAEHSYRMTLIGYALGKLSQKPIDMAKLLLMCLFHDLPEARTGDLNYINKRYVKSDEFQVIEDIKSKTPVGETIAVCLTEYMENKTDEAHLAHDADQLELLLVLKEQHDTGNPRAMSWFEAVAARIETETAKSLAEAIRQTPSDGWWFGLKVK